MITLIHKIWAEVVLDYVSDLILFLDLSPKERDAIAKIRSWKQGELACHDDSLLDSNSRYLLLSAAGRLFLVDRRRKWKGELDEMCIDLYSRYGRRAFRRIRKRIVKTAETYPQL